MQKTDLFSRVAVVLCIYMLVLIAKAHAACRNPNVADGHTPWFLRVAASNFVEIKWFSHAFFQITSSSGK